MQVWRQIAGSAGKPWFAMALWLMAGGFSATVAAPLSFKPASSPDNWNVPANWYVGDCSSTSSASSLPADGDVVIICAGKTVNLNVNTPMLASITVENGAKIVATANTITVTSNFTVEPGGILELSGTNQTFLRALGGNLTLNGQYLNRVTISGGMWSLFGNFFAQRSGTGAALTILSGTLNTNSHDINLDIDGDLLINGGVLNANSSTITVKGSYEFILGSFNAGTSTANAIGSGYIRGFTGSNKFNTLRISATGVYNLKTALEANNLEIYSGTLSTQDGFTFHNIQLNGDFNQNGGNLTLYNTTIMNIGGNFIRIGGTFNAGTGVTILSGSGAHTINPGGATFYDLIVGGPVPGSYTAQAQISTSNNFTIKNGILDLSTNNYNLTVGGDLTIGDGVGLANSAVLHGRASTITVTGNWSRNTTDGQYQRNTVGNQVLLVGNSTISNMSAPPGGPNTFWNLSAAPAGFTTTIATQTNIVNQLTIGPGTYQSNADTLLYYTAGSTVTEPLVIHPSATLNGSKTFVYLFIGNSLGKVAGGNYGNHTIRVRTDTGITATLNGNLTTTGNIELGFNVGTRATLNTNNYSITAGSMFIGSGSDSPGVLNAGTSNVTLSGSLVIGNQSIAGPLYNELYTTGGTWSIAGNFTNNSAGTVNLSGSTFVFNGTANQMIGGSSTTTFHNLTLANSGARNITFPAGATTIINGQFNATGSAGNIISLRSSTVATQTTLTVNGSLGTFNYLNIQDHKINGTAWSAPINPANSIHSGNTIGWFTITLLYTRSSGNWSNPMSWSDIACGGTMAGVAPNSSIDVIICNTHNISMDALGSAQNFTINGGSLTANSGDLAASGHFTVTAGTVTIHDGRTITTQGNFQQTGGVINLSGTTGELVLAATAPGSYTISQTGGTLSARLVIDSAQNYDITSNLTATRFTKRGSGTVNFNNHTLNFSDPLSIEGGTVNANSATVNLNNDFTLSAGTLNMGTAVFHINANSVDLSGGTFNPQNSTVNLAGTPTLTGGASFYNLQFSGSTLNMSPINRTVSNNFTITPLAGTMNLPNGTTFTVQNFDKQGGTLVIGPTGNASLIVNGSFAHTGGSITATPGDTLRVPNAVAAGVASQISLHRNNTYAGDITDDATVTGYLFPYMQVHAQVVDPSRNLDTTTAEILTAVLTTSGGDNETITLTETGPATGIFRTVAAGIATAYGSPTASNSIIEGLSGHVLSLNYTDTFDSLDNHSGNTFDTQIGDSSIKRWNLAGPGNWNVAANWLPVGVPSSTEDVSLDNLLISTPYTITLDVMTGNVRNLTASGNFTLNLNLNTLQVAGNFNQSNGTIANGIVTLNGSLGPYTISQSGGTFNASLHINSTANYSLTSSFSTLNLNKNGTGTLNLNGHNLTIASNLDHLGGTLDMNSVTVSVGNDINLVGTTNTTGSTLIWNGAGPAVFTSAAVLHHFTMSGSGTLSLSDGITQTLTGNFSKSNGTLVLGPTGNSGFIINGSFTHSGGNIIAGPGDQIRGVPATLMLFRNGFTTALANDPTVNGYSPGATIYLQLTDANRNLDNNAIETLQVTLTSTDGEHETLTLTETANNSGIFRGTFTTIDSVPIAVDGNIQLQKDAIVTVAYTDIFDTFTPDTVTYQTKIGLTDVTQNANLGKNGAKLADNYIDFRLKKKTIVGFNLQKNGHISVELYDMKGRKIKTIHEGNYPPGDHFYTWDVAASGMRSGMYFIQIMSDSWPKPVMQQLMIVR